LERDQRALPLGYASLRRCCVSWSTNKNNRLQVTRALDADEGIESSALSLEVREVGRMEVPGRYDNGEEIPESSEGRVEKVSSGEDNKIKNGDSSSSLGVDVPVKRRRGRPRKSEKQEPQQDKEEPTELIFKLERRGYGWGEEIIPYLTVEKRPVKRKSSGGKKTVEFAVADDPEVSSEVSVL